MALRLWPRAWLRKPDALSAAKAACSGWLAGNPKDYDRTYALDGHPAAQVESGGLTVEAVAD